MSHPGPVTPESVQPVSAPAGNDRSAPRYRPLSVRGRVPRDALPSRYALATQPTRNPPQIGAHFERFGRVDHGRRSRPGVEKTRVSITTTSAANLEELVIKPVRRLANHTIDQGSIIKGILLPRQSIADEVADSYREYLFGNSTLQDLPADNEGPRFVINATNVQTKVLWRFSRPYMGDYRVGLVKNPTTELAVAVAASSAFPPFLSPAELELQTSDFDANTPGVTLKDEAYRTNVVLTDGGVYDNLGLETAWKSYDTILVSDGGGAVDDEADPERDWARHSYRILSLIDNQVRSLRKRQVIDSYKLGARKGAYWGIRTNIADYALPDAMNCPFASTIALANVATRLKALDATLQDRIINWGYAVCDAALRKHVDNTLPPPGNFPYPAAGSLKLT